MNRCLFLSLSLIFIMPALHLQGQANNTVAAGALDTSKTFNIISAVSAKSLDVEGHSTVSGAKIVQNTTTGELSQHWKLVNITGDYFLIINGLSGKALSSIDNNNGTQLQLDNIQPDNLLQQWRIISVNGRNAILSHNSALAADVSGGSQYDNVPIVQWANDAVNKTNQQWFFTESSHIPADSVQYIQRTNLPSIYINTENNAPINSKEIYVKGKLVIAGGSSDSGYYDGDIEIRGRGNSTWNFTKKPYRIKLAKKYNLLGMSAKAKNWVLLANHSDKTLMRNALAFEISKYLGFKFTASYRFADVFINGDYQGNYLVTDQIEVAEDRVKVEEQETDDTNVPQITGGYLLEIDGFASTEPVWFKTNQGIPITVKYPKDDEINQVQRNYISNFVQEFENALMGPDFKDSATGYRKYTNVYSLVDYYILSEITGNADAFWSTYITKRRNQSKLFYGPVWDFDQAFYNNGQQGDVTYRHVADFAYDPKIWIKQILKDDYFNQRVKIRLSSVIGGLYKRLQFVTDSLTNLLQQSQQLNFAKWPVLNSIVFREPAARGSYANEVQFLKEHIADRFNWLKKQLKDVDTSKIYNIVNRSSGKAMDTEAHSVANGAKVVQYTRSSFAPSQQWRLLGPENGYYRISNSASQKVLSSGDNNDIQLRLEDLQPGSLYQQWRIINLGDGYSIINRADDHAADVSGGSSNDNVPIVGWYADAQNKFNQQWTFLEIMQSPSARLGPVNHVVQGLGANLFPNPVIAGQKLLKSINLPDKSKVIVLIYTTGGLLVKRENKGVLPKGKHSLVIHTDALQRGQYMVKIVTQGEEFVQALLIH